MAARHRLAALGATLLAAGLLAIAGLGAAVGELAPAAGLRIAPWNSELAERQALAALADGREDEARSLAHRALKSMPLTQSALTIVTLRGTPQQRLDGLNQSAALGWRDLLTDLRLVSAAFTNGDPVIAAQRIDAFARIAGGKAAAQAADRLLLMRGGIEALSERAAFHVDIGWLPDWLDQPATKPEVAAARAALMRRVDSDNGDWRWLVIAHAIRGIDGGGHAEEGFALWRATLADKALWGKGIYDPAFTRLGEGTMPTGGEWHLPAEPTMIAERGDNGLHLAWEPAPAGPVIYQIVQPAAGQAVDFSALWQGSASPEADFAWQLQCHGGGMVPLRRELAPVPGGWRDRYSGPAPACPLAILSLVRLTGGTRGEAALRDPAFAAGTGDR